MPCRLGPMPMQIPLFPLHTVLAPGIALPLHVFEDRYRQMVRHCLDAPSPFGVVLIRDGSEVAPRDGAAQELSIAGVGTFAEIREASRYADGRWDLLAVGTSRFVVREVRTDVEPYLVAEVDPYPDQPGARRPRGRRGARRPGHPPVRGLPPAAPAARRRVRGSDRRPDGGRDRGASRMPRRDDAPVVDAEPLRRERRAARGGRRCGPSRPTTPRRPAPRCGSRTTRRRSRSC